MIILPDKNIPRAKFLMPVKKSEWRASSQALKKDQFGNENKTRFIITAKLNDGHIIWKGYFDDREDFDVFLWAIVNKTLPYERELWDLPNDTWTPQHKWLNVGWMPSLGENVSYIYAVTNFLVSPTGSNQTYTKPADWNSNSNTIEVLGGGASGSSFVQTATPKFVSGGGGGAYSKISNFSFNVDSIVATYQIATGGDAYTVSTVAVTSRTGNAGNDTWFNATTFASSSVGAKGGTATAMATTLPQTGAPGGAAGSGIGTTKNSGGAGGSTTLTTNNLIGTGGGGCAGPNGNGLDGRTLSSTTGDGSKGYGGAGDNGFGGVGGTGYSDTPVTAGGNGTTWDPSYGCGGGGGENAGNNTASGGGGNYGGGSGSCIENSTQAGNINVSAGSQGLIVVIYTPLIDRHFNMPILGL